LICIADDTEWLFFRIVHPMQAGNDNFGSVFPVTQAFSGDVPKGGS
jgi:hypothetical protein